MDLMILIILRKSNLVDTLMHPLLILSLIVGSSVNYPNNREHEFCIFSSIMDFCFTYAFTFILNNMVSKSFSIVVEVVIGDVGLGMVYCS